MKINYILPVVWITFFELLKNADLNFTGIAVLGDGSDNLDRHPNVGMSIDRFNDLAKSPLSEKSDSTICQGKYVFELGKRNG